MGFVRKCQKCGLEITDGAAQKCPVCGTALFVLPRMGMWLGAVTQIALSTIFMLVFGFPKIMIAVFAALILLATAFSAWLKPRQAAARNAPQRPVANPVLLKILSLAVAACSLAVVCILLFGFVIFMNAWNRWHQYEGQPLRRADFEVTRVYYQMHSRGGAEVFASGNVEGSREWMNLAPYLHFIPRSQRELESRVSAGTIIRVYFFPALSGRARVQVIGDAPPAEASRHSAMSTLNYGLMALGIAVGLIFVLSRMRSTCFTDADPALQPATVNSL